MQIFSFMGKRKLTFNNLEDLAIAIPTIVVCCKELSKRTVSLGEMSYVDKYI
jgi:hypothetical protein